MSATPQNPADIATILVYVGIDAPGDALMKLPFAAALRRAWPDARITWLAGKGPTAFAGFMAPLAEGLIDEVIQNGGIGSSPREFLRPALPGRSFDLIIDTQRRFLTSLLVRRIRHRRLVSGLGAPRSPWLVQQLLDLVERASGRPAEVTYDLPMPAPVRDAAARLLPADEGPFVAVAPGAGGRHKCWPLERFTELARDLPGLVPVVILGPAEREWEAPLRQALPGARFPLNDDPEAARRLEPRLTIALGARCRAAVANDSGVGHMLAASGVPLVSLFGPSSSAKFRPLARIGTVVEASEFGGTEMERIPVDAVREALLATAAAEPSQPAAAIAPVGSASLY